MAGLSFRVRGSIIWEGLRIEPHRHYTESVQFRHAQLGCDPGQTQKKLYLSAVLCVLQEELEEVAGEEVVWESQLKLPLRPR